MTALAIFETIGSIVGVLITLITFFTLISKRPIAAFRKIIREESEAANGNLKMEIENINSQLQTIQSKQNETDTTNQAILRNTITHIYFKYKDDRCIPHYEKENALYLFEQYEKLHGNSYVKQIIEDIKSWDEIV